MYSLSIYARKGVSPHERIIEKIQLYKGTELVLELKEGDKKPTDKGSRDIILYRLLGQRLTVSKLIELNADYPGVDVQ